MKAQLNLRSMLSHTTTFQRRSTALAALALMALIGALLVYVARPSAHSLSTARVVAPAQRGSNVLDFGTSSVYDGGHYVDWQPIKRVAPKGLDFGTGSVYDGGHYVDWQPIKRITTHQLNFGTGSVYDGGHYGEPSQR